MADYYNRSKSYSYSSGHRNNNMQMDNYYNYGSYGPRTMSAYPNHHDFRSHGASYSSSSSSYDHAAAHAPPPPPLPPPPPPPPPPALVKDWKLKKGKSTGGTTSKSWSFNDPEFQRKRRVASYKVYSVEGKVKGSFRRSFRWLKDKYTQVVYGWW